jgi:hypothetical protein
MLIQGAGVGFTQQNRIPITKLKESPMFAAILILSAAMFAYLAPAKLTVALAIFAIAVSLPVKISVSLLSGQSPSFFRIIKAFALAFLFWFLAVLAAMSFFSFSISAHSPLAAIIASPFFLIFPFVAYLIAFSIVLEISILHALLVSIVAWLVSSAIVYAFQASSFLR